MPIQTKSRPNTFPADLHRCREAVVDDMQILLTYQQAARLMCVCGKTVELLVRGGKLPCVRLGAKSVRIRRSDVEAWINQHTGPYRREEEPK